MNLQDVALKAAAARNWRWLAGALARGEDPTTGDPGWLRVREFHNRLTLGGQAHQLTRPYPDLNDPATVGCLLALVREAWEPHRGDDSVVSTMQVGDKWGVGARYGSEGLAAIVLPAFDTEAEALIKALEAAP